MSTRTDDPDIQPLSEHETERYMTAFQAGLRAMDSDPAEAARIGRLAGKTDAQVPGGGPSAGDTDYDSSHVQDLAALLAQPDSELDVPGHAPPEVSGYGPQPGYGPRAELTRGEAALVVRRAEAEAELALRRAEADVDAQLILRRADADAQLVVRRAEADAELALRQAEADAELVVRRAEADAELALRRAELEAQQRKDQAEIDVQRAEVTARKFSFKRHRRGPAGPVLAIAATSAVAASVLEVSAFPLVAIVLASAVAAFAVAYSIAILVAALRLALRRPDRPHPGAETALRLLVGAGRPWREQGSPE